MKCSKCKSRTHFSHIVINKKKENIIKKVDKLLKQVKDLKKELEKELRKIKK